MCGHCCCKCCCCHGCHGYKQPRYPWSNVPLSGGVTYTQPNVTQPNTLSPNQSGGFYKSHC